MSLLRRLAVNNITKNFRISFLTILSVAVSVSMITVVVASSLGLYEEMRRETLEKSSRENVTIFNVKNIDALLDAIGRDHIEATHVIEMYQLATFDPDKIERNNLVYLKGIDIVQNDQFNPLIGNAGQNTTSTTIIAGRLPQNEHEVVIGDLGERNGTLKIGKKIHIVNENDGNKRRSSKDKGYTYNHDRQPLTVVGIVKGGESYYFYDNQKRVMDPSRNYNIAIKLKPDTRNYKALVEGAINHQTVNVNQDGEGESNVSYNTEYNQAIGLDTDFSNTKLALAISGLIFIVILLAATFTLVFNAFNVLVETNVKTYGLLRSVGATKRQIKHTIRFEGFILSLFGSLLGCALGFGLSELLFSFINPQITKFFVDYGQGFTYHFNAVLPWFSIVLIVVVSMVMASIPLYLAVRKMFLQTSIEGIRHANLNTKNPKKNPMLESSKSLNFQIARINNRSASTRSRGVQTALVITIILFVSLSSFNSSVFSTIGNYGVYDHNISFTVYSQANSVFRKLDEYFKNEPLIKNVIKEETSSQMILYPDGKQIKDAEGIKQDRNNSMVGSVEFRFIADERYQQLRKENGITNSFEHGVLLLTYDGTIGYFNGNEYETYDFKGPLTQLKEGEEFVSGNYDGESIKPTVQKFRVDGYLKTTPDDLKRTHAVSTILIPLSQKATFITGDPKDGNLNRQVSVFYKIDATNPNVVHQSIQQIDPDLSILNYAQKQATLRQVRYIIDVTMFAIMAYIGSVSIMNMISITITNYNLRKQILAVYRSVGMSRRTLQKVFVFESLLTFIWPLFLGIGIGATIPLIFWWGLHFVNSANPVLYYFDISSIGIAAGFILIAMIANSVTLYFQSKKHSIIEEMRHL